MDSQGEERPRTAVGPLIGMREMISWFRVVDHRTVEGQDRKIVKLQTQRSIIFRMKYIIYMLCHDSSFSKPYHP